MIAQQIQPEDLLTEMHPPVRFSGIELQDKWLDQRLYLRIAHALRAKDAVVAFMPASVFT
jgi:hypothetical protein